MLGIDVRQPWWIVHLSVYPGGRDNDSNFNTVLVVEYLRTTIQEIVKHSGNLLFSLSALFESSLNSRFSPPVTIYFFIN